jgi:uncharacterized protein YdeI (YjbR/CyaY-like superfamily)
MPKSVEMLDTIFAEDRKAWRAWLADNHAASPGIWLILSKKGSGKQRLTYDEVIEEALCSGWIDNIPNKIDSEKYKLKLSPRKPDSTWAKSNKDRVQRLIQQGLMTQAGLAKIESAKADGSWDLLNDIDDLKTPEE